MKIRSYEEELLRNLLRDQGISEYELDDLTYEGQDLPGAEGGSQSPQSQPQSKPQQ